ncbi:MAG: MFS transporter [Candidatus Binatia bacterium]
MNTISQTPRRISTAALVSWALYDWANSAFATVIQTFVFAAYFVRQVAADEVIGSTLWGNTLAAAGLVVAVGGPVLGAIGDQSGRSKLWTAAFSLLCIGATALLWFVKPSTAYIWPALLLVGVGTIGVECATIFYNAMLPKLVEPECLGRWSGWAWSLGYLGGLLCLVVALLAFVQEGTSWFQLDGPSAQPVRMSFLLAAGWYLLFALPLFAITPEPASIEKPLSQAARDGLQQLWESIHHARRYKHILHFLIARMIYIDGLATLFAFGGVYAAGTFAMTEAEVLVFGIALNATAGLGAAAFAWVDDWIGGKRTILVSLAGLIVSATLILLVESSSLFWTFGLLLGVFVGPVQAASRSLLARMAPEQLQNQLFGLYALSGKATAFAGPLLVGWVTYWAGSQRIGMSVIIVFFCLGFVLLWRVPAAEKAPA